jgi:uncharacterized membrane protein
MASLDYDTAATVGGATGSHDEGEDMSAEQRTQRRQVQQQQQCVNVGRSERTYSVAAGSLLALLGISRRSTPGLIMAALGGGLIYRGVTGHCQLYEALGIDKSHDGAKPEDYFERGIHVEQVYTIAKSSQELYAFWRNFENLPKIMTHLELVRCQDGRRSHWVAKAPGIAGGKVEWDAEIINDEPNALIAWRSLPGADVDNAGSVRFVPAPGDRGTEVRVVIDYIPPAGRVGKWIARLFGEEPQQQIRDDLGNFKRKMETGELPSTGQCGDGG